MPSRRANHYTTAPLMCVSLLIVPGPMCMLSVIYLSAVIFSSLNIRKSIIYTTKVDGVVCPPNISETVAGRLMKLAHRPRIASTMIKLISKPILLPTLLIILKTIQPIGAGASNIAQINMQVDANGRVLVLPSGRSICMTFI